MGKPNESKLEGDILDQLNDMNRDMRSLVKRATKDELPASELQQFVLNNSAELVNHSLEVLENLKTSVYACPTPDNMEAFANVMKAAAAAMDTLNKIEVQRQRSETQEKVKVLDIRSKLEMQKEDQEHEKEIVMTRSKMLEVLNEDSENPTTSN